MPCRCKLGSKYEFRSRKSLFNRYAAGGTKTFAGALNTANVSVDLTNTAAGDADLQGFNLIGNPFPSALTWNASAWGGTTAKRPLCLNNGSYGSGGANDVSTTHRGNLRL